MLKPFVLFTTGHVGGELEPSALWFELNNSTKVKSKLLLAGVMRVWFVLAGKRAKASKLRVYFRALAEKLMTSKLTRFLTMRPRLLTPHTALQSLDNGDIKRSDAIDCRNTPT
jgi:hypothetical protein